MTARDDYPKLHRETSGPWHQGEGSQQGQDALDEIDRLRTLSAETLRLARIGAEVEAQPMLREVSEPMIAWDTGEADPNDVARLFTFNEKINAMLRRFRAAGEKTA